MKQLSLLLLFCISFSVLAQKDTKQIKQFTAQLDQKIPQLLTDFNVPGTAIAIIENGTVIHQKAYGYSNLKTKTKVTSTTGFNIGSISKTIAAWGVMKLVQDGKIDLDAPVEKYLTRWKLPASKFDSNKVTIRRLLSHTAGLSLHGYPGWSSKDKLPTIEESLNGKNNGPGRVELIMEPGTQWKYSGGGYTILQLLIEEVTQQKFADFMQQEILNPMGMTSSSYTIDTKITNASSKEYNNFSEEIDFELFTAEAAAGLHTTIADFTKFALASLYDDKNNSNYQQILTKATLEEMMQPAPASNNRYGLGYQIQSIPGTSVVLKGHGGANSGWHSFFRVNPETNDGFIMITNGGAGHNIYRQTFCDWVYWKTSADLGQRCVIIPSIANKVKEIIDAGKAPQLITEYATLKKNHSKDYSFSEDDINQLGYHYLGKNELAKALDVFKLNTNEFPESSNVYDSYAEALLKNGDNQKAIENYSKSVQLNPGNTNAISILKKLGVATDGLIKKVEVDEQILASYVGKYELAPDFVVSIVKKGNQLMAQAPGQGEFEIFPKSNTVFYLKVVEAEITFNTDENKKVESMTLNQGGRKMTGQKLKD